MSGGDVVLIAAAIILVVAAVVSMLQARRLTIAVNNWGAVYGMQRMPRESTQEFASRIRARQTWARR